MADINVLMVGGRRAGKTSLLASLKECCDLFDLDQLTISAKIGVNDMNLKIEEMTKYFKDRVALGHSIFAPDHGHTGSYEYYEFEVNVNNSKSAYTVGFTDVPGEYYGSNEKGIIPDWQFKEIKEELQTRIKNSQVFLIAIDTPHLMEKMDRSLGYGEGHEKFNRVHEITEFFKKAFEESAQPRLVLFVPMKCEKYRKKMGKVAECVKKGYAQLITQLSSAVGGLCTVAIAPIFSLGCAQFLRFQNNDCREVGEYHFVTNDQGKCVYSPENCEQPLLRIMQYLMNTAKQQKEKKNTVVRWFQERFLGQARLADLLACEDELNDTVIEDEEQGYIQIYPERK